MEGIIKREDLARDFAEYHIQHYDLAFNLIMRMDDFDFLQDYHKRTGRWLKVIAKNRYFLN